MACYCKNKNCEEMRNGVMLDTFTFKIDFKNSELKHVQLEQPQQTLDCKVT
jgi:hypothetical protein